MSVLRAIKRFYNDKEKRGWNKGYFFVDIHGTILKPNYTAGKTPTEAYPYAIETLQFLSSLPDIDMVLYTCSHPHEIDEYIELFKKSNIKFKFINENPEVATQIGGYGCYDKKPYMNVLFEDKAGFDPEVEWLEVLEYMKSKYEH